MALRYQPSLEAFVEKRFGRSFVLRFSAQNLLNRQKKEDFRKYDGDSLQDVLNARDAGAIDEYEIERERDGRLFQVTLRAAFYTVTQSHAARSERRKLGMLNRVLPTK